MTGEEFRGAILALIDAHPALSPSKAGHAAHALRFMTTSGQPLAIEPERQSFQNLWVRADGVNARRLSDIESRLYDHTTFEESKPNHNLFGEAAFKDTDLICFKVVTIWEAVRVIAEAAGMGDRR